MRPNRIPFSRVTVLPIAVIVFDFFLFFLLPVRIPFF
ncbi:hypothetical protein SBA3_3760008 [Candidatus Sulfopaludibacter sp. SbA3]|nr:hypothetical protein SBA3_3760008 [Candidatus Sulfopaludibacter sp. SbA3]